MPCNFYTLRSFGFLTVAVSIGYSQSLTAPQALKPAWSDEIIYSHFFRHVNSLERQAKARQQSVGSGEPFRHYYRGKLNLSPSEELDLKDEARQFAAEIAPVQAEIAARIRAFRENHPKGLTARENLPSAPPYLQDLTAKKSEILQRHIGNWRISIGGAESARLNSAIRAFVSPRLQQISLTDLAVPDSEGK
jgi:hypothetical protein